MSGKHRKQDNTEKALEEYKIETPDHVEGKVDKAEEPSAGARQETK